MSCGSVAPPSTWITSKLWHSFIRLEKSSNVPARRPRAVSMMFGGPEVTAKATQSIRQRHVAFGIDGVQGDLVRRGGERSGNQSAGQAHDLRGLIDLGAGVPV